jgi:hypothetical protein
MSRPVHFGQDPCLGNVVVPHAAHLPPIKRGDAEGQVKSPSAIGMVLAMQ